METVIDGQIAGMIVRRVRVNRGGCPSGMLFATRRHLDVDSVVADSMPCGEGDEVEVVLFKVGHPIMDNPLEKEFERHGLLAADPWSLTAVNQADPTLADSIFNATHWKDSDGRWCCIAFHNKHWNRIVTVYQHNGDYNPDMWFAGIRPPHIVPCISAAWAQGSKSEILKV